MNALMEERKQRLGKICERYGVARINLSSSATGEGPDPEDSDLEFVVSFDSKAPPQLFDRCSGLKENLERLFGW